MNTLPPSFRLAMWASLACLSLLSLPFTPNAYGQQGASLAANSASSLPKGILGGMENAKPGDKTQPTKAKKTALNPDQQPIAFSHQLHAGENQIDCQYCHLYARRSSSAGVPPVYVCAGCHRAVKTESPEIQKLMGYWERQEPIPWVKVFDIPDFVRFPHAKHVNARNETFPQGVACQTCHGQIEAMAVVKKENPDFGKMGWCLECHLSIPGVKNAKRAIADDDLSGKIKDAQHPRGYARPLLTDCLTCHY